MSEHRTLSGRYLMGGETTVTGVHYLDCNSRSRTTVNDTILHTNSFVIRTGVEPVRTMSQEDFLP